MINPYEILDFYYIDEYIINILVSKFVNEIWDDVKPKIPSTDKKFIITGKNIGMINCNIDNLFKKEKI